MKVQVSRYLTVSNWTDPMTGIVFDKKMDEIEIPKGADITNIKKWLHLNYIKLISGSVEEHEAHRAVVAKVEAQKVAIEEEMKQMEEVAKSVVEEQKHEETEVVVEEKPKPKRQKKTT